MHKSQTLSLPAQISIGALLILGFVGGSLVVAYSGYETSPRKGGTPVFVPTPDAYFIAACMYAMSCLALLALLRNRTNRLAITFFAFTAYLVLAYVFIQWLGSLR